MTPTSQTPLLTCHLGRLLKKHLTAQALLLAAGVGVVVLLLTALSLPSHRWSKSALVSASTGTWQVSGGFERVAPEQFFQDPPKELPAALAANHLERLLLANDLSYFRALHPPSPPRSEEQGAGAAELHKRLLPMTNPHLTSPCFLTPASLQLATLGALEHNFPEVSHSKELFLESETQPPKRLKLFLINPPQAGWTVQHWHLPSEWHNLPAHLVFENTAPDELKLGLSLPHALPWLDNLKAQAPALIFLPYLLFFSCFVLTSGLWMRQRLDATRVLSQVIGPENQGAPLQFFLVLGLAAWVAYAFFFLFFLAPHTAKMISLAFNAALALKLIYEWQKNRWEQLLPRALRPYFLLLLGASFFYLCIIYAWQDLYGLAEPWVINRRFRLDMASDNCIPFSFAERVFTGDDPRDMGWDWHSSDRPPLQTGWILSHFIFLNSSHWLNRSHLVISSHVLQTLLQCLIFPSLLAFMQILRWPKRTVQLSLAFCLFSGTFLFNSTYTWPKFLAASLVFGALSCLIALKRHSQTTPTPPHQQNTRLLLLLGACLSATAALLTHGGVIFTLLPAFFLFATDALLAGASPLAAYCSRKRNGQGARKQQSLSLRHLTLATALSIGLFLPWRAYQVFYDPPGDRLIKMHLAGVHPVVPEPPLQVIVQAYRKLSWQQFLQAKRENWAQIVDLSEWLRFVQQKSYHPQQGYLSVRDAEYLSIFSSLGVLNLGGLLWLLRLLLTQKKPRPQVPDLAPAAILAASSLVIWIFLMFSGKETIPHQGSYATSALLFLVLSACVSQLPRLLARLLLTCHLTLFTWIWLIDSPMHEEGQVRGFLSWPAVILGALGFCGLWHWVFYRLSHHEHIAEQR